MHSPYVPIVTNKRLVEAMLRMNERNRRKGPKPHVPRNARHGRPRGR